MSKKKILLGIGFIIMVLSAFLSLLGLTWEGLYQDTNSHIVDGWWINDWVTLLIAVPMFAVALFIAMKVKSQIRGLALLTGLMMYTVYNYSYYLFGAAFNAAFLAYIIVFVLGMFGLLVGGILLHESLETEDIVSSAIAKGISSYMVFTGVLLSIAWIGQWIAYVVSGTIPELMERFESSVHLVAILDLTLVVPWFLLGAYLLWKQHVSGLVVGFMVHMKTAIYNIILLWASYAQWRDGVEGAGAFIPLWSFFLVGSSISLILLLLPLKNSMGKKSDKHVA